MRDQDLKLPRQVFIWFLILSQAFGSSPALAGASPVIIEAAEGPKITRGIRIPPLDYLASLLAIPGKLIFWNRKFGNHNISRKVEEDIRQYLIDNELYDVQVRLNQFAPFGEAARVFKNHHVAAPYRIIGFPATIIYASLGRLLGGSILMSDYYDPFSNTVHIFSDHTAIALHEGGHAKDFAYQKWRGSYALARIFSLTAYMQESTATEDAIDYLILKNKKKEAVESYKVLYPAYSSYLGSALGFLGYFIAIAYGHWYGRFKAEQLAQQFQLKEEWEQFRANNVKPVTTPAQGL